MSKQKRKKQAPEVALEDAQRLTGEQLTQEQIRDIKKAFRALDLNKNGRLTVWEVRQACMKLKILLTKDEMTEIIKKYDADGNGGVEYHEFEGIISQQLLIANYKNGYMRKMFEQFDVDGDGFITGAEIKQVFRDMGTELTEEEINELITEADENNDGVISFEEFVQTVCEKDW